MRKTEHTRIENLAALGNELSEEHLRLAAGGLAAGGRRARGGRSNSGVPTYHGPEIRDGCTDPVG